MNMNRYEQQFEENAPHPRAGAERLQEGEAEAVVTLWAGGQGAPSANALPTLAAVAEGLGTTIEETERLLREVRARGLHAKGTAQTRNKAHDTAAALMAGTLFFGMLPFSCLFRDGNLEWMLCRDQPLLAGLSLALALAVGLGWRRTVTQAR